MARKFNTKPSVVGRPANWSNRERIFRALCRGGAVNFDTAPRIAKLLKLTKEIKGEAKPDMVTVNNHLRNLTSLGLIKVVGKENRPGRGRPSKVYALTPMGQVASTFR